jgi:hypothetical protein
MLGQPASKSKSANQPRQKFANSHVQSSPKTNPKAKTVRELIHRYGRAVVECLTQACEPSLNFVIRNFERFHQPSGMARVVQKFASSRLLGNDRHQTRQPLIVES